MPMPIWTTSSGASGVGTDRRRTPRASCTMPYWPSPSRAAGPMCCPMPGWVATRMGGPGAPDDIDQAHLTQAWLAASDDPAARTTGGYFYHLKPRHPNPQASDIAFQDRLLIICEEISGVDVHMGAARQASSAAMP